MVCGKVDNPWGLVIIASAFWIQFVSFGMATSFGVYIVELLHHFDVSLPFISLIGSVNIGLFLGAGNSSFSPPRSVYCLVQFICKYLQYQ